jgi:endonuclease YncB( thermonuclease family)
LNLEITCVAKPCRRLIAKSNGTIHVLPIEEDRYGRTVAELWIPIKPDYEQEIHLNTAMVEAGMAYHYQQYSGSCESAENLGWAEKIARDDKLGVWNGSHQ